MIFFSPALRYQPGGYCAHSKFESRVAKTEFVLLRPPSLRYTVAMAHDSDTGDGNGSPLCLTVDSSSISKAAQLLAAGRLVAFPTETVYGLGGDARNAESVAAIFAAKDRPSFNPLISHVADAEAAFALGQKTPLAMVLADAFWPGPLTLILHRQADCQIAMLTSAGLDRIALRVPAHEAARALLREFGGPVAAPSANPSGRISPSRADHVVNGLGDRIDLVLDGGPCESGVESTVVDCSGDKAVILRPGGVTREQISAALTKAGLTLVNNEADGPKQDMVSPGMMQSHYAPTCTLKMNVLTPLEGMELIGFGEVSGAGILASTLSASGNLVEAAANLFDRLHAADATGASVIGVAPIPTTGIGEAINDRLSRAAAPRS